MCRSIKKQNAPVLLEHPALFLNVMPISYAQ
jgi:hypothetical protein